MANSEKAPDLADPPPPSPVVKATSVLGLDSSVAEEDGKDLGVNSDLNNVIVSKPSNLTPCQEVISRKTSMKALGGNDRAWADVVQKKSGLQRYDLVEEEVNGKKGFRVPEAVLQVDALWADCIVGKFLSNSPHIGSIHMTVNKIWSSGNKDEKVDVYVVNDTMVKFRIKDPGVRARVLRRGMWNITDIPMLVSKWNPFEEESQPEMTSIRLWVLLKNVPRNMYSWPGLSHLFSPFGEPKQLHPNTVWWKNPDIAKVFVEVDLTKTLPESHCFHPKNGKSFEVQYEFPWLPPHCSSCSRWGHLGADCKVSRSPRAMLVRSDSGVSILKNLQSSPIAVNSDGSSGRKESDKVVSSGSITQRNHCPKSPIGESGKSPHSSPRENVSKLATDTVRNDRAWQSPSKTSRLRLSEEVLDTVKSTSRFSTLDDDLEGSLNEEVIDQDSAFDVGNDSDVDEASRHKDQISNVQNLKKDEVPIQHVDMSRASLHRDAKAAHKYISGNSSPKSSTNGRKSSGKKKRKNKKNH